MTPEISKVRFTILADGGKVKAMAGFCVNDLLYITGCRIIEGSKGMFLSWPSRKVAKKDGSGDEYKDICFPASKESRDSIQTQVLASYEEQTGPGPSTVKAADIPFGPDFENLPF